MYLKKNIGSVKKLAITAGVFACVISTVSLAPIHSQAKTAGIETNGLLTEKQIDVAITVPDIKTEQKTYWKDGKDHPALTEESVKELATWVADLEVYEDEDSMTRVKAFPNITPELLEAQWLAESRFFIDATNGQNGTGNCVGLAQISCKWNIDRVKKWCYIVGEDADLVETKEDARRILLEYPEVAALVQADKLQGAYNSCTKEYSDNPLKFALAIYRWGNMADGQVEYNGGNHYCDNILSHAESLKEEYEEYREQKMFFEKWKEDNENLSPIELKDKVGSSYWFSSWMSANSSVNDAILKGMSTECGYDR